MQNAVLDLVDNVQASPGAIVALGQLDAVGCKWVDVEATVKTLWKPSAPSMQQVGLLEDEAGKTKLIVWKRSHRRVCGRESMRRQDLVDCFPVERQ